MKGGSVSVFGLLLLVVGVILAWLFAEGKLQQAIADLTGTNTNSAGTNNGIPITAVPVPTPGTTPGPALPTIQNPPLLPSIQNTPLPSATQQSNAGLPNLQQTVQNTLQSQQQGLQYATPYPAVATQYPSAFGQFSFN